jgi:PAS domain S-box-containing protein
MTHEIDELREQLAQRAQELQASEARLRNLLVENTDAILIVDVEGRVDFVNPAAEALFSLSSGELIGSPFGFPLVIGEMTEINVPGPDKRPLTAEMRVTRTEWGSHPAFLVSLRDVTLSKQQETHLLLALEQVNNIRFALDRSAIVAITDEAGRIEYANDKFCEISKYSREELIGQHHRIVNSGYHPRAFWVEMWRTISRGNIWRGEIRNRAKDGSIYWVDTTIVPFLNERGKPRQYIAIRHEITARKLAEEHTRLLNIQLERRNQELLSLHEVGRTLAQTFDVYTIGQVVYREVAQRLLNIPHMILALLNPSTQMISPEFCVVDGLEVDAGAFPPMPISEGPIAAVVRTRQPVEADVDLITRGHFTHIGSERRSRATLYVPLTSRENVIGVMLVQHYTENVFQATDMTLLSIIASQAGVALENAQLYAQVRQHADELEQRVSARTLELQRERAQLQTILDAMVEGVVYIDQATQETRYVNGAFTRLTGYLPQSIIGRPAHICRHVLGLPERAASSEPWHYESWQGECVVRHRDGSSLEADASVTFVLGPGGVPIGEVVLFRDAGQEHALQAQKDRFIASASHELRTPVTSLKMRLYLARRQPELMVEHLEALENVTNHMMNLIETLLDLSRFERGMITLNRTRLPLQDLILRVIADQDQVAAQHEISLRYVVPDRPLYALVDKDRMLQVIGNLVANAINYTPAGGSATVELSETRDGGQRVALLRVADTGIGIAPDALPHIFEPFYRAGAGSLVKGTGLGLAIVHEIVTLHNGDIRVESRPDAGSVFSIQLPLDPPAVPDMRDDSEGHDAREWRDGRYS